MAWRVAVHTGVGSHPGAARGEALEALMTSACRAAGAVLGEGGDLLDACDAAVTALEDSGLVNAGAGAHANADGVVQTDACAVDSARRLGCVAAASRAPRPFRAAVALAKGRVPADAAPEPDGAGYVCPVAPVLLAGAWARAEGDAEGRPAKRRRTEVHPPAHGRMDTVGVVVRRGGETAAGVSSGGLYRKTAGRVGEAGVPGAGCWATPAAAVALSGRGEDAMRELLAARLCWELEAAADGGGCASEGPLPDFLRRFISRHATPCGGVILPAGDAPAACFYNTQSFGAASLASTGRAAAAVWRRAGLGADEWCANPAWQRLGDEAPSRDLP